MEMEINSETDKKQEQHKKTPIKSLPEFKKTYEQLRKKYNLPEYSFLNENFEIEILCELETELLLKRIRKQLTDKISSGLRITEMLINPQNGPMFIFNVVRSFNVDDKSLVNELYKKFAEFEIEAFSLETKYDEKKEAEFIRTVCKEWPEISENLEKINKSMKIGFKKDLKANEKSYFG
jgi:hypothetical protein